jgi:biopolymer transport protein ExbB/TolQ
MTSPVKSADTQRVARPRRSLTSLAAFVIGLPLGAGLLWLIRSGTVQHPLLARYVSHPVECVEVVLFCCALGALAGKLWQHLRERRACRAEVLPAWDGQPVPASEAARLLAGLTRLPRRWQNTSLVNRASAALDFVARRGTAADLDDHLRDLADADAVAVENSYALVRFITWAIPILGFLGTVLGITEAIAGVTPEVLEQSLSTVTDGLALAFDSTALALCLTMVVMFVTHVVDRLEQNLLETVDRYVARHLAHRFERSSSEEGQVVEAVRQNTKLLLAATDGLVQRQAEVWARALQEVDRGRAEAEERLQERMTAALETALERTLDSHARRLAALETQAVEQSARLVEQLSALAWAVQQQQAELARAVEAMAAQATVLASLQESEKQLVRLQETVSRNLETLAAAGSFEEAVHSLTGAVHLLTARVAAPGAKRPGVAA